jgi:hypothetical protein
LQCTHSCGKGVQHRRVNCHRVNSYGWIDPEQVSHGCNTTGKPKEVQKCVLADCRARYMWTVGPWEAVSRICLLKRVDSPLLLTALHLQCSWEGKGCGKRGRQRRKLNCLLGSNGRRAKKRLCKKFLVRKPKRARKCGRKICK